MSKFKERAALIRKLEPKSEMILVPEMGWIGDKRRRPRGWGKLKLYYGDTVFKINDVKHNVIVRTLLNGNQRINLWNLSTLTFEITQKLLK